MFFWGGPYNFCCCENFFLFQAPGHDSLSCELCIFLPEAAVSAFSATCVFWIVCLVLCVAASADVDIFKYSLFSFLESLCHRLYTSIGLNRGLILNKKLVFYRDFCSILSHSALFSPVLFMLIQIPMMLPGFSTTTDGILWAIVFSRIRLPSLFGSWFAVCPTTC